MRKQIVILIGVMTLIMIINNMAHPVTPELVNSIGYGSFLFGVLFATMSLANFFMSPVWGRLSDKFGRKPFMIMSPIGYGLAQLGFGFSTSPVTIVLFRLIGGAFTCAIFVCGMAYLIDITSPNERSRLMGIYTSTTGFGASIGYLLGGYIGNTNYHYAFIAQTSLSLLAALVIFIVIRDSKQLKTVTKKSNIIHDLMKYVHTVLPFLLIVTSLTSLLTIGFNNGFNYYLKDHLQFTPFKIGIAMAIIGMIGLFMNIILYPFIKRLVNDYYLLVLSIIIIVISLISVTYSKQLNIQVILLVPFFACLALYKPLLQSIISRVGINNGEIMGLNNAFVALGNVIGSFFIGWAYDVNMNLAFYSLSFVGIIVVIILFTLKNQLKNG